MISPISSRPWRGIRSSLANFEGPLDLLLHLIKRHEIDIYDIPIALITEQYLDYIDLMQELNLDVAGEFLVMAATLIHIKSRMLLPRPDPAQEDPEEDPREALVRRLLEHQKFKAAAELLHERETIRSAQWTRADGPIAEIAGEAHGAGDRSRSVQLDQRVPRGRRARQAAAEGVSAGRADPDRRSHRAAARAGLSETEACGFEDLFADMRLATGMIVTFLAMLEMIRLKLIRVFQSAVVGRSASTSASGPPTRRSQSGTHQVNCHNCQKFNNCHKNVRAHPDQFWQLWQFWQSWQARIQSSV